MIAGPSGKFSSPTIRWFKRQVTRSHHRMKAIHTLAQATTARRGRSKIGAPAKAITTLPAYQPRLKQRERNQRARPDIACKGTFSGIVSARKHIFWCGKPLSFHDRHLFQL